MIFKDRIFCDAAHYISSFAVCEQLKGDFLIYDLPVLDNEDDRKATAHIFNMYLCMLWAGITEDMVTSHGLDFIRSMKDYCQTYEFSQLSAFQPDWPFCYMTNSFDPAIAAYSGQGDIAFRIADITNTFIYDRLIERGCWEYLDKVTDRGSNGEYKNIMMQLLVKDHLRGNKNFLEYVRRYSGDETMSEYCAAKNALTVINDPDWLYDAISQEVETLLGLQSCSINRKEFSSRVIQLFQIYAKAGKTLKKFSGFGCLLLPENITECGDMETCFSKIPLPPVLTRLIDENTQIFVRSPLMTFQPDDGWKHIYCSCFFRGSDADEYEYIFEDFLRRYNRRCTVTVDHSDDLWQLTQRRELFDICLNDFVISELYDNINSLKKALNSKLLSEKNISEIVSYFSDRLNNSTDRAEYAYALKRLHQLNKKLLQMKAKKK